MKLSRRGDSARDRARNAHAAIARIDDLLTGGLATGDAVSIGAAAGGRESTLLAKLARQIDRGLSLSAGLRRCECGLSPADFALIEAGERSGDLAGAVAALRRRLDLRARTRRRLAQVLAYPAALVATTLSIMAPMSLWVLPSFTGMYADAGAELPLVTRTVMAAGGAISAHGLRFAAATFGLAITYTVLRRRSRRFRLATDRTTLSMPLAGRLARAEARADVYATLSALLGAGVDLDEALGLAAPACENQALRRAFELVRPAVRRGQPLSAAIARFGVERRGQDAAMLRTAEATGDYPRCLERLSTVARLERDELFDRVVRAVEPLTIASMAVVVGATVLAVYQPILGSASLLAGGMK
jgi:type II secretory pathway component PulF